ncbi:DUF2782 domain-containing protein [Zooshikella marina]|uniref:DUF2782 domain-containing protein n=1 Tax=Zooshikella ganghwensis TaxID=202772 RepID=A0A4P9VRS2_9GAMM|nr:DUF2782 domain-containing protein [Zooshikella ganghwensis]MBU2706085.1 DUF2782 domain-containing protein [Zooshikella ganghwensis]RDH46298.1 DUF2782 domain-containing protein [Zooshikella ganghwensis]
MKRLLIKALLAFCFTGAVNTAVIAEDEPIRPSNDVVIRESKDKIIHEYRHNGFVYAIKVVPKIGKPYFLVAADGEGNYIRTDRPEMLIPSWKILEW